MGLKVELGLEVPTPDRRIITQVILFRKEGSLTMALTLWPSHSQDLLQSTCPDEDNCHDQTNRVDVNIGDGHDANASQGCHNAEEHRKGESFPKECGLDGTNKRGKQQLCDLVETNRIQQ